MCAHPASSPATRTTEWGWQGTRPARLRAPTTPLTFARRCSSRSGQTGVWLPSRRAANWARRSRGATSRPAAASGSAASRSPVREPPGPGRTTWTRSPPCPVRGEPGPEPGQVRAGPARRVRSLVSAVSPVIERQAHPPVLRRGSSDTWSVCPGRSALVTRVRTDATGSVRCRPRTTRGSEPAVVRTAMARTPTGPRWPDHSPTRETNESSPGVSPAPSGCGLEPNGIGRPNPMVGLLRVHAEEEDKTCPRDRVGVRGCWRGDGRRATSSDCRL